jgi:tRNA pseudouridine55 synthase
MQQTILPCGILPIYKEKGMTSHDCVNIARRLFNTRAVGHTGTLDPMAEGVLVLLVGRATKLERFLVSDTKEYSATLRLGIETDTEDTTGAVLRTCDAVPECDAVTAAVESMLGESEQLPPMYSAVKVGGKKLYEYAREGKEVERKGRMITVSAIDCEKLSDTDYRLDCTVSSGTYIRTLCADIGRKLGCGGAMASLLRTRAGRFSLNECVKIDGLREEDYETRLSHLIPPINALEGKRLTFPPFFERLYLSGCEIYQKKIGTSFDLGDRVLVFSDGGEFLSIGSVRQFPQGTAIKSEIIM